MRLPLALHRMLPVAIAGLLSGVPASYGADADLSIGEGDRVRMLGVGVALPMLPDLPCVRGCSAALALSARVAYWWLPYDGGHAQNLVDWSLTPTVRVSGPLPGGRALRVEIGVGAHYLSQRDLGTQRHFGSNWQFGEFLQVGYSYDASARDAWFARLEHVSNGGFNSQNSGVTFFGVTYRRTFGW